MSAKCRTQALEDGTSKQWMIELTQRSQTMIGRLEPVLNLGKGEMFTNVQQKGLASWKGWADSLGDSLGNSLAQRWTSATEGGYGPSAKRATSFLATGAAAAGTGLSGVGKQG